MFTDILKIKPQIDSKDLQAMERQLQSRFTKIAKGFGKGVVSAFKGGGIAGIALGLIDKLLNPIKEVQEAIDRSLKSSDDIVTNAKQFDSTTGKLAKVIGLAKATGLDQDNLFMLINKYQNAVAEARKNPNDPNVSSVANFTGQKDTVEGFFQFIQSLQRMNKDQQVLVQSQIFGEKQILKMADFLQADFPRLMRNTGLDKVTSEKIGGAHDKLGSLNDLRDELTVKNSIDDTINKSNLINEGMIRQMSESERLAQRKENEQIKSYKDLATISDTVTKMETALTEGLGLIGKLITTLTPFINQASDFMVKFLKSPMVRGVKGLFGGKDD